MEGPRATKGAKPAGARLTQSETLMEWLWIVIVVLIVLLLLGYFGRGRPR
jgi:hypothetical protein